MKIAFLIFMAACSLANAQPASRNQWNLKADFSLVTRCIQAARMVIVATESYPESKEARDEFLVHAAQGLRRSNEWGERMPSDIEITFAKAALDGSRENIGTAQGKEISFAQSASVCTLHSSRVAAKSN